MRQFIASDGARITYRDEGSGTPLVLLHGLMAHGGFFRAQADLADRFRMITVDLRGHGASRDTENVSVERMAADISELSEALDLQAALGLGWSLGAIVLWHVLAGSSGHRFAGAVIVDMTACVRNRDGWTLGLPPEMCEARSAAIRDDFHAFAVAAGQAIFAEPDAHRDAADWASFEFARNEPQTIASVWESLVRQDARALLAGIAQPTLIAHGARSALYGEETAEHLVHELPAAAAVRFERSGHAPHLEEPELFNQTLRDFADRLAAAPAPVKG